MLFTSIWMVRPCSSGAIPTTTNAAAAIQMLYVCMWVHTNCIWLLWLIYFHFISYIIWGGRITNGHFSKLLRFFSSLSYAINDISAFCKNWTFLQSYRCKMLIIYTNFVSFFEAYQWLYKIFQRIALLNNVFFTSK